MHNKLFYKKYLPKLNILGHFTYKGVLYYSAKYLITILSDLEPGSDNFKDIINISDSKELESKLNLATVDTKGQEHLAACKIIYTDESEMKVVKMILELLGNNPTDKKFIRI